MQIKTKYDNKKLIYYLCPRVHIHLFGNYIINATHIFIFINYKPTFLV